MKEVNNENACMLCMIAFILGCVLAFSGCAVESSTRVKAKPVVIETTLELECCADCGFVPWTDSWCEHHHAT
jgi:hypothetical protein